MPSAEKETALVLSQDAVAASGSSPVHFPGFPGVWAPDQPIAVSALGFGSEKEALAEVKLRGLPLEEKKVDVGSAPMPARPNHIPSGPAPAAAEAEAPAEETAPEAKWPQTHAELDDLGDEYDVEFEADAKVADKIAALEAAGVAPPAEEGEG
jgi:hypothetical protein